MENKHFAIYRCVIIWNRKEDSVMKGWPTMEDIRLDIILREIERLYSMSWENESGDQ